MSDPGHSTQRVPAGEGSSSANFKDPHLKIVRRFAVSPQRAFDAFTRPDDMRIWWQGDTRIDTDLRVGGRWTITRRADGTVYTATGEYQRVDRPRRVRYTYAMPQFSPHTDMIDIEIVADGDGCWVFFVQSGPDIAAELAALPPGSTSESESGWQQGFELMAEAWARST